MLDVMVRRTGDMNISGKTMLSAMLPATVNVLGGDEETPVTYGRLRDGLQDTFRGTYTFDDEGGMENRHRQYNVERNRVHAHGQGTDNP